MKKYIYSLVTALALCCGFASCGDDDDTITFSTSAEQGSAGTYSGTWSKSANGNETTSTGTVTLAAASTANNTNVTLSCTEFEIDATSIANVTHASNGYVFNNNVSTNPLGTSFAGRIDEDGTIQLNFQKEVREGRQRTIYVFTFIGKKN